MFAQTYLQFNDFTEASHRIIGGKNLLFRIDHDLGEERVTMSSEYNVTSARMEHYVRLLKLLFQSTTELAGTVHSLYMRYFVGNR